MQLYLVSENTLAPGRLGFDGKGKVGLVKAGNEKDACVNFAIEHNIPPGVELTAAVIGVLMTYKTKAEVFFIGEEMP